MTFGRTRIVGGRGCGIIKGNDRQIAVIDSLRRIMVTPLRPVNQIDKLD